jgi:hypothetical protein
MRSYSIGGSLLGCRRCGNRHVPLAGTGLFHRRPERA